MIIDSHTHADKFGWYDPPETIIRLMDEAGVDKSIIMTYAEAPDVEGSLEYIAEAVQEYPDRLIGYARMNPRGGEKAHRLFRKAMEEYGFKGLKLHPVGNLCHPGSPETIEMIRLANSYRAPTLFHCGDEEFTLPLQIAQAAEACPEATIILGHCGGYFHTKDAIRVAERFPNIVLETSAMPYPRVIKEAVQRVGASRLLYASDGPGCDLTIEVHKVKMAGLTEEEEEGLFGAIIGLTSGYYGGWWDLVVSRVMDVLFSFPAILLAIAIMAVLGQNITNVMIAIGIVNTPIFARVVRASAMSVRTLTFVEAAESIGASNRHIIFRHLLPNCLPPLVIQTTVAFAWAVIAEAGLSFLGLGTRPPTPSWGLNP